MVGLVALVALGCDGARFGTSDGFREQDFGAGFERSLPGWRATWEAPEGGSPQAHLRMSRQGVRVFNAALVRMGRVRVDGEGGHRLDARDGTRQCHITHAASEHLLWCDDERWLAWRPEEAEVRSTGGRVAGFVLEEGVYSAALTTPPAVPGGGVQAEAVSSERGVRLACPVGEEDALLRGWRAGEASALALCVAWQWGAELEPSERLLIAAAFAWMVAKGEAASAEAPEAEAASGEVSE